MTEKEKALAHIVKLNLVRDSSAAGVTVPDCEEDGGYAPKQCYGDRYCDLVSDISYLVCGSRIVFYKHPKIISYS